MIFLIGVVCGFVGCMALMAVVSLCSPSDGYLRVDRSDGDPYLFLEVSKPVEELSNKKSVIFQVKNEDFLSHD